MPGAQPQPSAPPQADRVYGVDPGEAHTIPNAEGALWFTSSFNPGDGTGLNRALRYGIPETDAIAFSAVCNASPQSGIPIWLSLPVDGLQNGQDAMVGFELDGRPLGRVGKVSNAEPESAGITINASRNDPFWGELAGAGAIAFGLEGQPKIQLPGAGQAVRAFVQNCGISVAAPPPVQMQGFPQPQTFGPGVPGAPPGMLPPQPRGTLDDFHRQ